MSQPQPLFILTCMRSFSSLVSSMLGQHPGLYCLPEVNPFIAPTLGRAVDILQFVRKRTLDGLYRAVAELEHGAQTEAAVRKAQTWVADRRHWSPVEMMDHFAARVAPRRLIEKSPSTTLAPERVDAAVRLFPEAKFLHLYRHPVSTTASIAKITGHGQKDATRAARGRDPEESWYDANTTILKVGAQLPPGHFMSARGEDILTDPDTFLVQVCHWLGLDVADDDLAAMKRPEESPYASIGPASAPFGNDPNFLRHPNYARRDIHLPSLGTPLDWAGGRRYLTPATVALSQQLGYGRDARRNG